MENVAKTQSIWSKMVFKWESISLGENQIIGGGGWVTQPQLAPSHPSRREKDIAARGTVRQAF